MKAVIVFIYNSIFSEGRRFPLKTLQRSRVDESGEG
jgi:hypothetical protein